MISSTWIVITFGVIFIQFSDAQTGQWKRTQCGKFADLVTQWGLQVNPNNTLPEYPRPQLVRPDNTWRNLNGLWGFRPAKAQEPPPFGQTLNQNILVPFPVESCLSGIGITYKYLWYRTLFGLPSGWNGIGKILLHFGAVDWQATVYLNQKTIGSHTGGYDPFTFDITSSVRPDQNELIVYVYDPSDDGFQPNGKQRISAIDNPGGDSYTPSSGIWQTVWIEHVPSVYIESLVINADLTKLVVSTNVVGGTTSVQYQVLDGTTVVATQNATSGTLATIPIPSPKFWSPSSPFLYGLRVSIQGDSIQSYFGMRTIVLAKEEHPGVPDTGPQTGQDRSGSDLPGYPVTLQQADPNVCWNMCKQDPSCKSWAYAIPGCDSFSKPTCWLKGVYLSPASSKCRISGSLAIPAQMVGRPHLNGEFLFLAGWLDQSWWPDGQYTAPTDEALAFDLQAVKTFGLNSVRLHQKVNPARWYYHADRLGIVILQDMIQKFGGATSASVAPFLADLKSMINGLYNHPSIIQWTVFNEGDCVGSFDVPSTVKYAKSLDSTRLFDTNSGGPANDLHIADVNDFHTYPWPGDPIPNPTQYAMLGEFGGIGAFVPGHEWVPKQCGTYLQVNTPEDEANTYIQMAKQIQSHKQDISVSIYTQISDVERECDGFLNYDRTNKFNDQQTNAIREANQALINSKSTLIN